LSCRRKRKNQLGALLTDPDRGSGGGGGKGGSGRRGADEGKQNENGPLHMCKKKKQRNFGVKSQERFKKTTLKREEQLPAKSGERKKKNKGKDYKREGIKKNGRINKKGGLQGGGGGRGGRGE